MHIFINPQQAAHAPRVEVFRGQIVPCFENSSRYGFVLDEIKRRGWAFTDVYEDKGIEPITRVHAPRYVEFLRGAWDEWLALDAANAEKEAFPAVWPIRGLRHDVEPSNFCAKLGLYSMDSGSPLWSGTWTAAYAGAQMTLMAAQAVMRGEDAFVLTRPPGHHAGVDFYGGYSFLNNAAIAAQYCRDHGAARVAVIDVDYHHGNGTQDIFYARDDVLTTSVHGDPMTEYPFYLGHADELGAATGLGFNLNLPLAAGSDTATWYAALGAIIERVRNYRPDVLIVALGVDAAEVDPISQFKLQSVDFTRIGEALAGLQLPTLFVMEGGYAVAEIGVNVANVLAGFERAKL